MTRTTLDVLRLPVSYLWSLREDDAAIKKPSLPYHVYFFSPTRSLQPVSTCVPMAQAVLRTLSLTANLRSFFTPFDTSIRPELWASWLSYVNFFPLSLRSPFRPHFFTEHRVIGTRPCLVSACQDPAKSLSRVRAAPTFNIARLRQALSPDQRAPKPRELAR